MTITGHKISTRRRFQFSPRIRELTDETRLISGELIDVHATRLLVRMRATVATDGALHLSSAGARLRLGRMLLRVPTVPITLHQWWDDAAEVYGIRVTVRVPLLGEVFGYAGTFTTETCDDSPGDQPVRPPPVKGY